MSGRTPPLRTDSIIPVFSSTRTRSLTRRVAPTVLRTVQAPSSSESRTLNGKKPRVVGYFVLPCFFFRFSTAFLLAQLAHKHRLTLGAKHIENPNTKPKKRQPERARIFQRVRTGRAGRHQKPVGPVLQPVIRRPGKRTGVIVFLRHAYRNTASVGCWSVRRVFVASVQYTPRSRVCLCPFVGFYCVRVFSFPILTRSVLFVLLHST